MPKHPSGPIRRSQLVAPFGPGAMVTVPGGTSVVIAGLDHWFGNSRSDVSVDVDEFRISEWRLQQLLEVDHLRLPPDFRKPFQGEKQNNVYLTIPSLRFPTWYFCSRCRLLTRHGTYTRGRIKCPECERDGLTRYLAQVPFIAICEKGHMQDFPWNEWVHESPKPTCVGRLRLKSSGRATLAGQYVECDLCGARRSLGRITSMVGESSTTFLSTALSPNELFLCGGNRPWLGPDAAEQCGAPLKGSLRSASNVYYANVVSSLYLPRSDDSAVQAAIQKLEDPSVDTVVMALVELMDPLDLSKIAVTLKRRFAERFSVYDDSLLVRALAAVTENETAGKVYPSSTVDAPSSLRWSEFQVLRETKDDDVLRIRVANLSDYVQSVARFFSRICLVEKLRETRALVGFGRVYPSAQQDLTEQQRLMWRDFPKRELRWLPAYTVFGEGIFFEFSASALMNWEAAASPELQNRIQPLAERFSRVRDSRRLADREITPRFVMIHTFAHLLINQLTFDCGYSSAALRERLYVSSEENQSMAGLLIYTAAGDSEGTMGGLVRLGRPGFLEAIIQRALSKAKWCSADPICMEMGEQGQGPDSCNLAACHNCALVPETACEEFNRFLDRGVVVGRPGSPRLGYFSG